MTAGKLLLIRHAETDLAGTFCGSSDPPINAAGEAQIAALLEALSKQPIDAVYSSDLKRAQMTAQPIAAKFLAELHTVANLREIHFGEWESLTWREIEQRDPVTAKLWLDRFPKLPVPGGDHISSFEARVLSAFDALTALEQNAAIVTHAGVIRVLLKRRCMLSDEEAWNVTKPHCSIFEYSPREVLHTR